MGTNLPSLHKVFWKDIKEKVSAVNATVYKILEQREHDEKLYFYIARYPYGSSVLENGMLYLPNNKGELVSLTDRTISKDIQNDLSYNLNSNPVSLVLSNSFEIFLPIETSTVSLNGIMKPGKFFGAYRILNKKSYQPMFIWNMTAGARSIFVLPRITEEKKHLRLQKKYNVGEKPEALLDQWRVFKEIANDSNFHQTWNAEILFFPKHWFDNIDEPDWESFYFRLYKLLWEQTEFSRNTPVWNLIYSIIQKDFQRKPSAYILDTVKYLIHMSTGVQPGFGPAMDETTAPIKGLQEIYRDIYGLTKHPLTFMTPTFFDFENPHCEPAYYSLQYPFAFEFGRSTRSRESFVDCLHEIKALITRCESEIISGKFNVENTPLFNAFRKVDFTYYHAQAGIRASFKDSSDIIRADPRLYGNSVENDNYSGSQKSSFLSAGIRLSKRSFPEDMK